MKWKINKNHIKCNGKPCSDTNTHKFTNNNIEVEKLFRATTKCSSLSGNKCAVLIKDLSLRFRRGKMYHHFCMLSNALNCIKTAFPPFHPQNCWQIYAQWSTKSTTIPRCTTGESYKFKRKIVQMLRMKNMYMNKNNTFLHPQYALHITIPDFSDLNENDANMEKRNLIFIHNWKLVWGCFGVAFLWSVRNYKKIFFFFLCFVILLNLLKRGDLADDWTVPMIVFKLNCLFNTKMGRLLLNCYFMYFYYILTDIIVIKKG